MHTHSHACHASPSRRDFFRAALGGALAGASVLEIGFHRAAWARAMAPTAGGAPLFDIEKVADGVYAAIARAQAMINSNAAIFVNSEDVLVVDAHSKPSAAASLIAQIKKEVTPKPVRFVVNSHFHWDHMQGNSAYKAAGKVDFVASEPTKQLMAQEAPSRLKAALDGIPPMIDALQSRMSKASSAAEKAFCQEQIRQLNAFQAEMKSFSLELPTIAFARSHVIKDRAHELHVEFHGHAHTAGDVVVFCPQKRAVATGDMIHGFLPYIADGFPKSWPKTMDSVNKLAFDQILPGHGPVHHNHDRLTNMRNYIEELAARVEDGKKAGKTVAELQQSNTVASLKSLQSNGYKDFVDANLYKYFPNFGPAKPLQDSVNTNIEEVYKNLDRV